MLLSLLHIMIRAGFDMSRPLRAFCFSFLFLFFFFFKKANKKERSKKRFYFIYLFIHSFIYLFIYLFIYYTEYSHPKFIHDISLILHALHVLLPLAYVTYRFIFQYINSPWTAQNIVGYADFYPFPSPKFYSL